MTTDGRSQGFRATLRLFVVGRTAATRRAVANARTLGEVDIIDVREHPHLAEADRIIATPTLIRTDAVSVRIIGDLSDLDAVRAHLGPPFSRPEDDTPGWECDDTTFGDPL
ncbi:circadian clock KaiB family protein [Roseospira visakhapatnamensis]|uniref:Circadian clock protein KaiB n=1 Tax=Roseospira visakhapatnamensis TaxID=390880 RepID=A0A7W6RBA9_9PROT|nr:circadian clock KaiB family protein [Roseospira visakhapatnamensis]MBB4264779.1 circadian clock protein KaiB [Roseospira visakhapatnamensis]